ncbi:hypothetical protein B6A27_03705 [Anoxybacillus sp. UARK-01]|uniref:glycosyltransferase n=1 Tax=Anoxybacillus sp. UARK-01 TaxID=1895648 RepID=UPI0009BC056B|nr:glycosyltransferase [Anoxybacillus sp. UARK-01]OQM46897.1 hypothetical protein B6A27_03705 [Anoxybacillus sp. UARK-01]
MMNDKKIAFIYCVNNRDLYEESVRYVKSLHVPEGYEIEFIAIEGAQSITSGYNQAMKQTDAKYKVYLHQDVFIVNKNFLVDTIQLFEKNEQLGMVGVIGAKTIPNSGIWWESENKIGKVYDSHTGKIELLQFEEVDQGYEPVQAIDGLLMMTQYDIPWREDIFKGWHFYDLSQSKEFINAGFHVGVPFQTRPWVVHDCGEIIISEIFEINRRIFVRKYLGIKDSKGDTLNSVKYHHSNQNVDKLFHDSTMYDILEQNQKFYRSFKSIFNANKSIDFNKKVIISKIIGAYGWLAHTGYYADYKLEDELLEMSNKLFYSSAKVDLKEIRINRNSGFKVLHVISTAYLTGGHTRLMDRWIRLRKHYDEVHSVVFTDQRNNVVPDWLIKTINEANGWYYVFNNDYNFRSQCLKLRKLAQEWADLVVLHTHPNDPIPILAFGNKEGLPPIILVNHADHVYWLGGSVSDAVMDIRMAGQFITKHRRGIQNSAVLPIPLMKKERKISKTKLREKYGLPNEAVILLSIASGYKFKPYRHLNFPITLAEVLRKAPDAILIVIGPNPQDDIWREVGKSTNGRIIVIGATTEIEEFYQLSDIFLESFPIGSLTAELDAMLYGLPVIKAPKPLSNLLTIGDDYTSLDGTPKSLRDYRELVFNYIHDFQIRKERGNQQREEVINKHTGDGWNNCLDSILLTNVLNNNNKRTRVCFNKIDEPSEFDAIWAEMQRNSGEKVFLSAEINFYNQILNSL